MTAPVLASLTVSGTLDPWVAGGFSAADALRIGRVTIRPDPRAPAPGITAWGLTEVDDGTVDGLLTLVADPPAGPPPDHPNTVVAIDHVVVASPDLDRTTTAFGAVGIELRRTRDAGRMEQRFFRIGEVVLELVGRPGETGPGPASFWGLALTARDLDVAATVLGDHLGPVSDAVQPGRRIATVRHEGLGLPAPTALLSPDPRRPSAAQVPGPGLGT